MPTNLEEWENYIGVLFGDELLEQAKGANTLAFVSTLQEEGRDAELIEEILRLFALRLEEDGQPIPTLYPGAYLDMSDLVGPSSLDAVEV